MPRSTQYCRGQIPLSKTAAAIEPATLDRLHAQATDSVRRDARRLREISERYREEYRGRLEEWLQLRARLDQRQVANRNGGASLEHLAGQHEAVGRDLAELQAHLKRVDVATRQLEHVTSYLASADPHAAEPTLSDADLSPASLSLRIIQAQEAERQHLAEEVHDGPAQVLTNAIFQVEYLDRVIDDAPRTAHAELAFLRTMLRESLDEVRSFITALRPPASDLGLADAIGAAGSEFASRHKIGVTVAVAGIDDRVGREAKAPVVRIVQEALQNVRKHSAATEVRIGLEGDHLVIVDNGRGFDVMRLASASRNFGLQFMRERAELMGSSLMIESRQGEGTRILLRLPEVR